MPPAPPRCPSVRSRRRPVGELPSALGRGYLQMTRAAGLSPIEDSQVPSSGSEPAPAFESAILDDGASTTSSHADAIPVLSLTTSNVWLVRTLHDEVRSPNAGEPWGRTPIVYRGGLPTRLRQAPRGVAGTQRDRGRENSHLVAKQQTGGLCTVPCRTREINPW